MDSCHMWYWSVALAVFAFVVLIYIALTRTDDLMTKTALATASLFTITSAVWSMPKYCMGGKAPHV